MNGCNHLQLHQRREQALLGQVPASKTEQGPASADEEAATAVGQDRDQPGQICSSAIPSGGLPALERSMCGDAQGREPRPTRSTRFDLTKVWPQRDYPLIPVGVLELNQNPDSFASPVGQAAFTPANVVPGIGFSPDRMLRGGSSPYGDTSAIASASATACCRSTPRAARSRHGAHRDGAMRADSNGAPANYQPNRFGAQQPSEQH